MKTILQTIIATLSLLVALTAGAAAPRSVNYKMPAGKIKVISYNIRQSGFSKQDGANKWNNRRHATLNMIEAEAPSVFGIQEGLASQVAYIEKGLPQYERIGVGRDDGIKAGEMMAIFYLKEYFDLDNWGTYWLSETPDKVSRGWDAACNRTITWAKLKEKSTGKTFFYFNTHLDHMGPQARAESVKLIVRLINEIAGRDNAVVLGGDLNSTIDDAIFAPFKECMSVARDAAVQSDNKGTFNAFGTAPSSIVLDHFFCRGVKCETVRTLAGDYGAPFISDHYPVELVLALD